MFSFKKNNHEKSVFLGHFPDNPQDKFYQCEKFKHLLNYLSQNPSQAEREKQPKEVNRLLDKLL